MSTRRTFLQQTAALAASVALPASAEPPKPAPLIDCNVTIGNWPFRDLHADQSNEIQGFRTSLRNKGVTQGWAGSFDALFMRDISYANEKLLYHCNENTGLFLIPAFAINPTLPAWKADLERWSNSVWKLIRLHPNYHGYTLDDSRFLDLLELATANKLLIQIVAQMEDERTQHPLMQAPPVSFKPLPAALKRVPAARVMILNANRAMSMTALQGTNVILDLAMLEGVGGIENLLKDWPLEQVVFGSHAPFFYFESAKLKLQESELSEKQLTAITHENAQRLLPA